MKNYGGSAWGVREKRRSATILLKPKRKSAWVKVLIKKNEKVFRREKNKKKNLGQDIKKWGEKRNQTHTIGNKKTVQSERSKLWTKKQ